MWVVCILAVELYGSFVLKRVAAEESYIPSTGIYIAGGLYFPIWMGNWSSTDVS